MDDAARYWLRMGLSFVALEAFLVFYPPAIEALVPNYVIHYELWIPLAVVANLALAWWAVTHRPGDDASRGSTES